MSVGTAPLGLPLSGLRSAPRRRLTTNSRRTGFENDCGTDQPARTHEECAQTGDHAVQRQSLGDRFRDRSGQQLALDQHIRRPRRARRRPASRATVTNRCRNRTTRSRMAPSCHLAKSKKCSGFCNSQCTAISIEGTDQRRGGNVKRYNRNEFSDGTEICFWRSCRRSAEAA